MSLKDSAMSRLYARNCPDFLRNDKEFPAIGRMVADKEGADLVWKEAKRLGIRLYEVKGWLSARTPASYLVVHTEDLSKVPVHPALKTWVVGLPIAQISRKHLRASREVIRSFDPHECSKVNVQCGGHLSMHFAEDGALA
jgi:hypothetical protein